ncbi:MAG: LacI family transcriptional regulator [Burkholderiales bacterium]|jgi:tripartite-type tricarboxylate transporter receptor subunit TctC|nr:LacI family transcriptional regulator [Burkholderiales bacterium]
MAISRILAASVGIGFLIGAVGAAAQNYPTKPIRFLVGFPPGGTNDIVARAVAPKLSEYLGQQVVVENRGGANTAIASELAARAAPDGYTLMLNAPGHATNPSLIKLNFDSIKDFAFITLLAESQNLLVVHPSLPVKTVKELVALSKKRPGDINYGSSGIGTTVHLSAELFQYMTGIKWLHVPYKGGGPGLVALLSGEVSLYFGNVPTVIRQARAGKLRAIATTGPKRSVAAPDIPTVAEAGVPGYEVTTFYGMSAPAKTPRPILERLHKETVRALKSPDLRERLQGLGAEPVGNTPEQYSAFMQNEIAKWGKVIKAAGIKAE